MSLYERIGGTFLSEELNPYIRSRNKKPYRVQLKEMVNMYFAHHYLPYHYIKHGLFKTIAPENYLDFVPPRLMHRFVMEVNSEEHAEMVKDKSKFRQALERHGLPCVREIVRQRADGRLFTADGEEISKKAAMEKIRQYGPKIFVKHTSGRGGEGAKIVDVSADQDDIFDLPGDMLYQPIIQQHPKLKELFSYSVNTIRIDTLKVDDGYVNNGAFLRMGCKTNVVDNYSLGGIMVGINIENGRLFKNGRQKINFGGLECVAHPDTGIAFADFQIPFWQDILEVVRKGAEALAPLGSLGWDVAVTPEGPVLVEANDEWCAFALQESVGGLAKTKLGELVMRQRLGHR